MKTGHVNLGAIFLNCPYCDSPLADPGNAYSYLLSSDTALPPVVNCFDCGKPFRVPARAFEIVRKAGGEGR